MSVIYRSPGSFGGCDRCESSMRRPSYEIGTGEFICGYCYAHFKGYVEESATTGGPD